MKLQHKTMIFRSLAVFAATLAAAVPAFAQDVFRAPRWVAPELAHLAAPAQKSAGATVDASGLLRVGDVRLMANVASVTTWAPVAGGYVARFRVTSESAQGIRARLDLGVMPGSMQLRAQGSDETRVESMTLDPLRGPEAWTPWTEGESQLIELFSPVLPSGNAVNVGALLHFTASPMAKAAAATCTLSTTCSSDDPTLDALIAERKKSVMRITFVRGGAGFVCSATLVDTPLRPAPYVLTANHCVDDAASSNTVSSFWFYEATSCTDNTVAPGFVQRPGGMQLVFTSYNIDSTLLLMSAAPPEGAIFSPTNSARMNPGASIVSISHPRGDTARWGIGTSGQDLRDNERPYDMYSVNFSRGIIEPGSSGSGVFTLANGRLELRGVLSQGALDLSCSQPGLFTLFARYEAFFPQIAPYIGYNVAGRLTDDAGNRPQEVTSVVSGSPIDTIAEGITLANRRIDYAGDVDLFKFTVGTKSVVSAYTLGTQDTVGTLYDVGGHALESVDDAQRGDNNAGITREMDPGTYYFGVSHWNPQAAGVVYDVKLAADHVGDNHTSLWWDAAESGWGININHQGNILFATLFTYNNNGTPVWLVMSGGTKDVDGSYVGALYSTTGPVFNANPWTAISATQVGNMRLSFPTADTGVLIYTFNGVAVTKNITRQAFKTLPECKWSAFDRTWASNFQDLWWNPAESGWGVNIAHQDDTLFATLFTYNAQGQPAWYVLSDGARNPGTRTYTGALYHTTGPAFNSVPWTPISAFQVGTMTFNFNDGNAGTMTYSVDGVSVTKQIQRQVFQNPKTQCES